MWMSIFAITFVIAACFCIAAIMMRPKLMRGRWQDALMLQAPTSPGAQNPQLSAQEYADGESTPRPVGSSVADQLRRHFRPVLHEPIPKDLMALIERLAKSKTPRH
jgi:hypothetical protein